MAPPIGKPIDGTRAYVLDRWDQPVPVGVSGELYIGGQGVSRGYLNRPDLTAERFVPDRFSGDIGARLYRTGDRARWLRDGKLEFLGRIDDQVKLRGYRIEPGEVESVLREYPGIRDAVIVLLNAQGDDRLVAYVTPTDEEYGGTIRSKSNCCLDRSLQGCLRRHESLRPIQIPRAGSVAIRGNHLLTRK